jgi:hypothetical protein
LLDTVGGERVAIIAVRIGAMPEAMEVESELLLAQFREERLQAEEEVLRGCSLSEAELEGELKRAQALMPLVHSTGGVLEYLQAALEIGRKQEEWQQWLADQLYPGKVEEAAAHFVYRSPALTVLLVGESFMREVYRKIAGDLESLHLAHRLDIVTCDTHYPIYDALSSLFTGPGRTLENAQRLGEAATAAATHRQRASKVYAEWRARTERDRTRQVEMATELVTSEVHASDRRVREVAQQPACLYLTYRVIRGGHERVFEGESARRLLDAKPSRQSAAQLHALALLAEQLAAVAPEGDEGVRETLLMDLDGRARYLTEEIKDLAQQTVRELRPGEAAQYLREFARATRT